jgi:pyridoxamine 5'-phosphate oxidase-like protein
MASWSEFAAAAPQLAERVQQRFEAHKHKTMATIRKDGGPRISGTECQFKDGELWIGSMWQAVKALDLRRDPRYALHSATVDPEQWGGEAKIAGVAEEILDEDEVRARNGEAGAGGPSHLFRLDVDEVSTVGLDEAKTHLVIEVWTLGRGVRTIKRT